MNVTRILERLDRCKNNNDHSSSKEYCPWSQLHYMERLRSFEWSWANRPSPCDIITCARHGWHHPPTSTSNEIFCSACCRKLYLPWEEGEREAERIIAEEYYVMIRDTGHFAWCPWRSVPCHLDISILSAGVLARWRESSQERNESFSQVNLSITFPDQVAIFINQMSRQECKEDNELARWIISIFGWRCTLEGLAICEFGCAEYSADCLDEFNVRDQHCWYCPIIYNDSWKLIIKSCLSNKKEKEQDVQSEKNESLNLTRYFLSSHVNRILNDLRKSNNK